MMKCKHFIDHRIPAFVTPIVHVLLLYINISISFFFILFHKLLSLHALCVFFHGSVQGSSLQSTALRSLLVVLV